MEEEGGDESEDGGGEKAAAEEAEESGTREAAVSDDDGAPLCGCWLARPSWAVRDVRGAELRLSAELRKGEEEERQDEGGAYGLGSRLWAADAEAVRAGRGGDEAEAAAAAGCAMRLRLTLCGASGDAAAGSLLPNDSL